MNLVLGVASSIAAYKAAELVRLFVKAGHGVQAVMTANATRFLQPLTLGILSGRPVHVATFPEGDTTVDHVATARWADGLLVAPATANVLGKFAHGIADDYLSTYFLAHRGPAVVAPAMNTFMWNSPAVRENLETLRRRGVLVVPPGMGALACGDEGEGRMAEPAEVFWHTLRGVGREKPYAGRRVVVTAGPTVEAIDPARFISNYSSGKMGYALARQAWLLGAEVTLLSGPVALPAPTGVATVPFTTGAQLQAALEAAAPEADFVFMAAAVCDFIPEASPSKIKRAKGLEVAFRPAPDIIRAVRARTKAFTVAFAAETENLLINAGQKLSDKGVDAIVANDVSRGDIGFGSDENEATLITARERRFLPKQAKETLALEILRAVAADAGLV
jgi:phosphopantothenoylcysteine decarboxylase/phosphopantothenate--cysteine ligase